jgi:putative transposase
MARLPRLSVGGWPHLVLQRGHNRQQVFRDEADRGQFLADLREVARTHGLAVHAYALLDTQLRLLVTPPTDTALSQAMQALGRRYGAYFNRRYDRTGSLWEGRFRTTVIEPEQHLLSCMRFVETAPPEGAMDADVAAAATSQRHHLGLTIDPVVSDHSAYWALGNTPFDREAAYRALTDRPLPLSEVAAIAASIGKGWPLGSASFVQALQGKTERRLIPLRRGRPPKVHHGDMADPK